MAVREAQSGGQVSVPILDKQMGRGVARALHFFGYRKEDRKESRNRKKETNSKK